MKTFGNSMLALFLLASAFFISYCKNEVSVQPNQPCIDNQPAEDTTRIYKRLIVGARWSSSKSRYLTDLSRNTLCPILSLGERHNQD